MLDSIGNITEPRQGIGILIGHFSEDELWITDCIIGGEGNKWEKLTIPPEKLAEIADEIIKRERTTKIVGWYYSCPGGGIRMSETNLETHNRFLRLSPVCVTLVADPEIGEFGIWALERDEGVMQVRNEYITIC